MLQIMLSIQSIVMNDYPYFNEPGYEREKKTSKKNSYSMDYNKRVRYDTLRVAIRDMLTSKTGDNRQMPESLQGMMKSYFCKNFERYESVFQKNLKTKDLLTDQTKQDYQLIVNELRGFKRTFKIDDDLSVALYKSIQEKFAPPPAPPKELNVLGDVDQFNEYIANTHDSD